MANRNGDGTRELFLIDGNSLAYRAFFALPESIATSDGRPTNAIFGFASMLVKILTDYGEVPTVVVWDAGMSGRKELSADFIGLKGDTSDNIPGVPGIGDKTAAELLQRFGDLEGVLTHVDEITGAKRKQNLIEHAGAARISKQLATMVTDVPIELDLEAELSKVPDRTNLRSVFREWEL